MDLSRLILETEGIECVIDFLIKYGLLPNRDPKDCIKCGSEGALKWTKNGRNEIMPFVFVCALKNCSATVSVRRNSLFDHISFPLSSAVRMIYFWLLKIPIGVTANQFQIKEPTVANWFKVLQEVCAFIIINYTSAIGGPDHTVEIGEYQLLTEEESHNLWIFTGVDRKTGQNFAVNTRNLDCETLWPIIKNYIFPGTQVVSSNFQEFAGLESNSKNATLKFVNPEEHPRLDSHHHLDELYNSLKDFLASEMPPEYISCTELYVYQFLYFNRDCIYGKPVSDLVSWFLCDVGLVYPGFRKTKLI